MDSATLKILLQDTPVTGLRYIDTVGSTNDMAMQWIESGASDFSLVVADQQTAGRGRMQRKWVTNPGSALAFSLILHLTPEEIPHAGLIPFLAAVSVSSTLEQLYHLQPQIKWPNDILLNGKKTTGILVESVWKDAGHVSVVIGIGVNITPASLPPIENLNLQPTCIEEANGHIVDRWQLLSALLKSMNTWRFEIGKESLIDYINLRLAYKGQQVRIIETYGEELHGNLVGIDPSGALLIESDSVILPIDIGDLHLRLIND
jgi:BirA family transcriptional regulator, biotin operon repressor / biotin---[acetyl-CoA-carboxylase] ligase